MTPQKTPEINEIQQSKQLCLINHNQHFTSFGLALFSLMVVGYIFLSYLSLYGHIADEVFHARMIDRILAGDWNNLPTDVTTPPFLHVILAFFYKTCGFVGHELEAMRFGQLLLSLGAIPCFFLIARELGHSNSDIKTLLCLLLPIYAPLFGLVYTDPPTITLTMLMILLTLRQQYWLAAGAAFLGVAMRQMTIIWACFCTVYVIISYIDSTNKPALQWLSPKNYKQHFTLLCRIAPFLLPAIGFVGYAIYNGGIVAGDKQAHHTTVNLSNLYSFLIAIFFLFIPYHLENASRIGSLLAKRKDVVALIAISFIIYMWQHKITHDYNKPSMDWWIHNKIMIWSTLNPTSKILFYIPITWAFLSLYFIAHTSRAPWVLYAIYFFGALSFVPLPLVELRYYIVTILLIILFKDRSSNLIEKTQLCIFLILTLYMVYATAHRLTFI